MPVQALMQALTSSTESSLQRLAVVHLSMMNVTFSALVLGASHLSYNIAQVAACNKLTYQLLELLCLNSMRSSVISLGILNCIYMV